MTTEHTDRHRIVVATGTRPVTLNAERDEHWAKAAKATDAWRTAGAEALLAAGLHRLRLQRCEFRFHPLYPNARSLPDSGASIYPSAKAIVDGFVDMGLVPDDNRWHNAGEFYAPPEVRDGRHARIVVELIPRPSRPGHDGTCTCREANQRSQQHNQLRKANSRRRRR